MRRGRRAALDRLRALHAADAAPPIWFVEACGVCSWAERCGRALERRSRLEWPDNASVPPIALGASQRVAQAGVSSQCVDAGSVARGGRAWIAGVGSVESRGVTIGGWERWVRAWGCARMPCHGSRHYLTR